MIQMTGMKTASLRMINQKISNTCLRRMPPKSTVWIKKKQTTLTKSRQWRWKATTSILNLMKVKRNHQVLRIKKLLPRMKIYSRHGVTSLKKTRLTIIKKTLTTITQISALGMMTMKMSRGRMEPRICKSRQNPTMIRTTKSKLKCLQHQWL